MRKPPPILGTSEIDYRLVPLFHKNHDKYLELSARFELLEKEFAKENSTKLLVEMMSVQSARFEAGVVCLFTATSILERILYELACRYIHFKSYEEHLDRLKLETKWLLVLKMWVGADVNEDSSELNELRMLIKARNAVVHPKVDFMRADTGSLPQGDKELARFHQACKNARRTIESLLALLKKSSSSAKTEMDPACLI